MSAVLDFPVKPEARDFLARFARDAREPGWLGARRQQAMTRFAELGFPSRKSESWRYFDLQPLERRPLLPQGRASIADVPSELGFGGALGQVVLADGKCTNSASRPLPEGVWLGSMQRAVDELPDLVRTAAIGDSGDEPFGALNLAFFSDGFVINIEPGVALDRPIEIIHFGSGASEASFHTRNLIVLGAGSRASIVETYAGSGRYWRNDVTTIRLGDHAALTRTALVEEAAEAMHIGHTDATLGKNALFTGFVLLLGGKGLRHEIAVRMAGEGARCEIDGGFLVSGSDEANIVTTIDHAAGGGQTRELIKGVAADRGHGAFQGCIVVREHAQKTDAHQLSRNLIIGRRAVIDTKPELEIYADDVKCSHGASVGDLDERALFYLRSRGIPAEEARRMLIEGFLRETVEAIADLALREHVLGRLGEHLRRQLGNLES